MVKALRKGDKGLLLLASNITPVDVISHLPLMAEEAAGVEYCWVLSKWVEPEILLRVALRYEEVPGLTIFQGRARCGVRNKARDVLHPDLVS